MLSSYLPSFDLVARGGLYHVSMSVGSSHQQITSCGLDILGLCCPFPLCAVTPGGSEVLQVKLIIYYSLSQ